MKVVCMPGVIQKRYKILREYEQAGFTAAMLDLSEYCSEQALENREELYEKYYAREVDRDTDPERVFLPVEPEKLDFMTSFLVEECKAKQIEISVVRMPALMQDTKRKDLYELIRKLAAESVKVCQKVKCAYLIIHPLIRQIKSAEDIEKNRLFYKEILDLIKDTDITILLQNCCDFHNGHRIRGKMADPYFLCDFVERLNMEAGSDRAGICLDIGTCNLLGQNIYEVVQILGNKIKAVILTENDGLKDSHMTPFTATVNRQSRMDWLNVIRGLRSIQFDGLVLCDDRDSRSAVSHMLRPALMQYEKKIYDFLLWQLSIENTIRKYDMRVLFGAGNMCRNYMKCYGEAFPPLYTCDNNEKIWGTTFEGLEIKNPQDLKNLPQECAIFICNVYYDEIEKQLRDMGLTNPIERFNDEYMPSQYTDRFDAEKREVRK